MTSTSRPLIKSSLRRAALVSTAVLLLASCGTDSQATNSEESTPTTDEVATTSTIPLSDLSAAYTFTGPYPVGVTSLELEGGNAVEIWYPAAEGTTGTDTYDVRDFVPPAIRDLLTAAVPATFTYDAGRDAPSADGAFPVVLFSHGFSGMRFQSTFLTAHLASWGMIVAAPDHWSRDLFHTLSTPVGDRQSAVTEFLATLDLLDAQNAAANGILSGHVDISRVVAVGHSAGGGTVLQAAFDDRIDGYVSLASGVFSLSGNDGSTPPATTDLPAKPSFFMAGALDQVVSAEDVTRTAYDAAPAPSRLWIIDGVGHNGFDDFCTFGNGTGIIGVAEASGLGPLLEAQPTLRRLGEDGCLPPAVPVTDTFPMIRHAITAQLRFWFGEDDEPIGIGPDVADSYDVAVRIALKP
ncbi:MAG: alpha/beta hydrolase family protein [Ilumatobacteraceae bacterium]